MGDHPCLGSPTRYAPLPSLSSPPRTAVQGLSYGPPSSGPAQMVATDTQVNQIRATLPSVAVLSPLGAGKLCSPFGGQHQLRPYTLTFTGQSRARFQQTRSLALSTGVGFSNCLHRKNCGSDKFGRVFSTPILSLPLPSWVTLGSNNCLAPSGSVYASAL